MGESSQSEKSEKPDKTDDSSKSGVSRSGWAVYKPGQGYWTRMCTAGAVAIVVGLICYWVYADVLAAQFIEVKDRNIRIAISVVLYLASALFFWRYMNRPKVADFLIDTELEMAKVNWTSAKELFGSTRVVIFFVFLISLVLFAYDLLFVKFFVLINILEV